MSTSRKPREILGGALGILSFVSCLVFTVGPDLIRIPMLVAGLMFGMASWLLTRKPSEAGHGSSTDAEVMATFAEEEEWLVNSIGKRLGTTAIAVEVDSSTFLPESTKNRIVRVKVFVNGRPLDNILVLPMFSGMMDVDSKETRRFMMNEQIGKLPKGQ